MQFRFFSSTVAALCAASFATAQEGTTPPPQPTPTPAVSRPGEAPAPGNQTGDHAPRARSVPAGVVENLPIPAVRPVFDLSQKGLPGREEGTERWILTFYQRSFDLSEFRNAIYNDAPVATVNGIVAGLERKLVTDQEAFAGEIKRLGGRVSHQWWIINGCAVEVPRTALVLIAAMPNVATMEPDRTVEPVLDPMVPTFPMILTSTNAANHNADAVQARGYHGAGVGYAIVDTGQDSNMAGSGQPHIQYFLNGVKPGTNLLAANKMIGSQNPDDLNGHGTGVCSIMGGNKWTNAGADFGHAHNATKVGYSICDVAGSCNSNLSTMTTAWNTVAADKVTYKIVSANLSYSGAPSPTDASQQALDSCALNADVMICVAAGNNGASTAASQSCANGLAVAACNATAKTIASFSCRGPLSGDTARFYPDITGCGVNTVMALRDSESGNYVASGTSMASPQVSGAAALIRSIDTTLTALETKAILLCTTEDISAQNPTAPYNSRNAYGMGFLRDDLAADQVLSVNSAITSTITGPVKTFPMPVTNAKKYSVALAWHRTSFGSTAWNDLNLRVLNGAAVVASSSTTRNLYEKVVFTAAATGTFTIEVSAVGALNPNPQTFALCHNGDTDCVIVPASAATVMGNSNNNIPFSWTPTRYQQVVRGTEVGGTATTFHHLGLRQDEAFNSSPGASVDLEIRFAQTTLTEATLTTTFATNMNAGAPVVVVPRHNVVLPNFPPTNNTNPSQFLVEIPFAQPYPWPATAGRNLIVDVTQRGNSRGNATFTYPLDAHSGATATTSRVFGFPDTATTGTLGLNYGLVLCLGLTPVGTTASYNFYGTGCAGTGPGIAQVILPAAQAAAMGNSNNAIPFSWTPTKYQQVFLGTEQTVARSYNGLGLRQDNALAVNVGGISVDLEMSLGYTTFTNATLTTTYAANFNSGAPVTVFPRQLVALPNVPAVANANPAEFFIKFPFSTPFPYVPAAGRNTLIQVIQRGNTFGNDNFGYFLDAESPSTSTRLFGADTALTGTLGINYGLVMAFLYAGPAGAIPLLTNTGDPVIGNTFSVDVWSARPSSVAILFLGVSNTNWGFIPLPFNLAGSGAPGCFIRASGEFLFAAGTNAFGRGSFPFGIPGDSSLVGGTFYNQYAVLDAGANPLGLSWTRGGVGVMGNK